MKTYLDFDIFLFGLGIREKSYDLRESNVMSQLSNQRIVIPLINVCINDVFLLRRVTIFTRHYFFIDHVNKRRDRSIENMDSIFL